MKKYMIVAAAFLMVASVASAQQAKKADTKPPVAKTSTHARTATNSTTSVSPAPAKKANPEMTIKRKHHHKKAKAATTSGNK